MTRKGFLGLIASFVTLITTAWSGQAKEDKAVKPQSPRARLLEEVFNKRRVPFKNMSPEAQKFLKDHWLRMEHYSAEMYRWYPRGRMTGEPREEAYRIIPWIVDPKFVEAEMPEYARELAAHRLLEGHYTTPERIA